MSKGSDRFDNKGRSLKDQQVGADLENSQFRKSLDVVDLGKKDGSTQPPVSATSSSSKVSSSRKSKTNLQEVKGSPVESVSSSPVRIFNQDKFMLTRKDLGGKGDTEEAVILPTSSPRKGSDGEDGAQIDESRMVQKTVSIPAIKHGSFDSSMHDFQDKNQSHISRRKALPEAVSTHRVTDTLKSVQNPCKPPISEQCPDDESWKRNQYHNNGDSRKVGKGSSSRSKDKSHGNRSECEIGHSREADSNGYADHSSNIENSKARSKLKEKITLNSENVEKKIFFKNEFATNPLTGSGHKGRDIDAPSTIRRDSTSQAANNAVKEAKDLKHLADRLKNSGSTVESMGLYFQAALKFLYGASLLEYSNNENSRHGEAIQSMQMYSSTAKLCEFEKELIVAVGKGEPADVMTEYGFKNFVSMDEYASCFDSIDPLAQYKNWRVDSQKISSKTSISSQRVKAAFIVSDPIDWGRDIQVARS